jgi:regulatory protein
MPLKKFTPDQSLQKIKRYCAYQERCHLEVRNKLFSYGLSSPAVEEIISVLIVENYLNEERFALQFARGKFRMRQWGINKIRKSLRLKQVSEYCIKKALREIDDSEYKSVLQKLIDRKMSGLKSEKNIFIKKRKLQDFLLQKGFESEQVREIIKDNFIKK